MKLSRIRVEQFKQFRQPIEIDGLEVGINLFTGPNEAGKSTLVAAIRAAFFERHRSGSVDDLRPWGDSSASPTVELEFAIDGKTYRLTKSFLGKKRCALHVGTRQMDGTDAEEHLAELLGFQYAGRAVRAQPSTGAFRACSGFSKVPRTTFGIQSRMRSTICARHSTNR